MSSKQILVTGGAGYIGSQTCALLSDEGFEPIVVDSLTRGHKDLVQWGDIEVGDLCDFAFIDDVIRRIRPVAVMHFASFAYVGESMQVPELYFQNNLVGGLNLLRAMLNHDTKNIVFASSCTTYGDSSTGPIVEDTPQQPVNPYGATKLALEQAIHGFETAHGLNSVILRYFNVAGADPKGRCGERHDPEPHIIPSAIHSAFGKKPVFELYGDDYPTPDGTCIRDYIHVHDIARAHVLSLNRLLSDQGSLIANLAGGKGLSVRDIINAVEAVTGREIPLKIADRRPGDPPLLVADATQARTELNWTPQFTDVEEMITHAVAWAQKDGQI